MSRETVVAILLGAGGGLAILSSIGVAVMKDAFQKLQFLAPVASISAFLTLAAIWLADNSGTARLKGAIVLVLLMITNSVLTQATAQAFRIRECGRWKVGRAEKLPHPAKESA